MPHDPGPVVAVVGATAAGKSELALDLAERLGGEIVNTDAMQVYIGMDIGTAKLPLAERRGIAHHLLDFMRVTETASVAEFQRLGRATIAQCHQRGRTPVLVGGSALYTRAILDQLDFPGTDPVVRERLETDIAAHGSQALHERLAELDPAAAAEIEVGNGRRIVRALEVIELTGRPFKARLPEPAYHYPGAVQIGVCIDRGALDERVARRVDQMWAQGLVEEVRGLAEVGLREGRTASRALGYQQVLAFLAGELTEEQAREQIVVATRRFARRQEAWFRKDHRIAWVRYDDPDRVEKALSSLS